MKKKYTYRKLEMFSLHGTTIDGALNYRGFFQFIQDIPEKERLYNLKDKMVALPKFSIKEDRILFTAYEGELGLNPLIFNTLDASERTEELNKGEILAQKTHGLIDMDKRFAIIEYNQKGAKANDIALVLEELGRQYGQYQQLVIQLSPKADQEFPKALESFRQIKLVKVSLAKPNISWADDHDDLSTIADESDAGSIVLEAHAKRNSSLSLNTGIVKLIKDFANKKLANMTSAYIKGLKQGQTQESSLSLSRHIRHQFANVVLQDNKHVNTNSINDRIEKFADEIDNEL